MEMLLSYSRSFSMIKSDEIEPWAGEAVGTGMSARTPMMCIPQPSV